MALKDILNDIEFKGSAAKTVLKWVIGIAGAAVIGAFTVGQLKTKLLNRVDNIEKVQLEMKTEIETGFAELNVKIDNIYEAGLEGFERYRIFNNQQLELIIEFGQSNEEANQELLKRMLKMNSEEKARQIETQIEQARRTKPQLAIGVEKIETDLPSGAVFTNVETGISIYYVDGAPENYLDTLNLEKFEIIEKKKSEKHEGLFDFTYKDREK